MAQDIIQETKTKMTNALDHFKQELRTIRAGRANAATIEGVTVEVYGSQMKVKDLCTISNPEPRQLVLTPFDGTNAGPIAKAIEKANLGLRAILEGKAVRVTFPELDGNRRKQLVQEVHDKREKCKVNLRNIRRDQNELTKKKKSTSEITEDDQKRTEKQIQELTDKFCKETDEAAATKEKEIMTV